MISLPFRLLRIIIFAITSYYYLKIRKNYKKFILSIQSMGPTFIKMGQTLATRQDLIGEQLAENLLALCDSVPPVPTVLVTQTLIKEFGQPISNLFSYIENESSGSASIAQVHKGITTEGRVVAIKILRPNIEKIFIQDTKLFIIITKWINKCLSKNLKRRLHLMDIVNRFAEATKFELDLRFEAANASELKENTKNDPGFYVPSVDWELTTQRVLTTEWVEGVSISKVETDNSDLVKKLAINFFQQVYRDGFYHADLHPGNLLVRKDGTVVAVDFGIMGRIDYKTRSLLAQILHAFVTRNYKKVAALHFKAGYIHPRYKNFVSACRAIGEPIIDKPLAKISISKLLSQLFKTAADFNMEVQPQLLLLQKNIMLMEGNCSRLSPHTDMWKVIRPYMESWYQQNLIKEKVENFFVSFYKLGKALDSINHIAVKGLKIQHTHHSKRNMWLKLIILLLISILGLNIYQLFSK